MHVDVRGADKPARITYLTHMSSTVLASPLTALSRRRWLTLAAAGGAVLLAPACSRNDATGRAQFVVVDDAQLETLSRETWAQMRRRIRQTEDAAVSRRLAEIGARVAEASGLGGRDWEFVVFESPEVNAFVLPGGKVGFFRGLIDRAGSDDEIAAVMGHEIGHVAARHAAERVSQHMAAQLGVQAMTLLLAGELGDRADDVAGMLGVGITYGVILPYSRAHELEADRLGVRFMAGAGYDPNAAAKFWTRMIDLDAGRAERLAFLSTHPANEDRLTALQVEIARHTRSATQDVGATSRS